MNGRGGEGDIDTYSAIFCHESMEFPNPLLTPQKVVGIRHGILVLVVFNPNIVGRGSDHQIDGRHFRKVGSQNVSVQQLYHCPRIIRYPWWLSTPNFFAFFGFARYLSNRDPMSRLIERTLKSPLDKFYRLWYCCAHDVKKQPC